MDIKISQTDREKIETGIREKYAQVANSPKGQFEYPTGKNGLEVLGYDKILVNALPTAVASSYCGVGNPFALGKIKPGEQILDIGCGAGVDTILAAILAGGKGSVIGVDIVTEMIERAECNLALMDLENVKLQKASGESLPFAEDTFDVVISNGVINLIPDKEAAMSEVIRVLKPAGRLMMADQIAADRIKNDIKERIANWFQ
jgi:SAM-dependent methyltransferase